MGLRKRVKKIEVEVKSSAGESHKFDVTVALGDSPDEQLFGDFAKNPEIVISRREEREEGFIIFCRNSVRVALSSRSYGAGENEVRAAVSWLVDLMVKSLSNVSIVDIDNSVVDVKVWSFKGSHSEILQNHIYQGAVKDAAAPESDFEAEL